MKTKFFTLLLISLGMVNAQTPWTYYPYGGSSASPFSVPNATVYDNTTISGVYNTANVLDFYEFDQVDATLAIWDPANGANYDIGRTVLAGTGTGTGVIYSGNAGSNPRNTWEKANTPSVVAPYWEKMNANPHAFENFIGGTAYFTVNFTEVGVYNLLMRIRGGNGNAYTVKVLDFDDIATEVADLSFNSAGIAIAASTLPTAGTMSTDNSTEYIAPGKIGNIGTGQANTIWVKAVSNTLTVSSAPVKYVIKVTQSGGSQSNSFAGLTFFNSVLSPSAVVTAPTDGKIVLKDNAVSLSGTIANNAGTVANVDFLINDVSFGGSVTDNGGGSYSASWTPTVAGSYTVKLTCTDDGSPLTSDAVTVTVSDGVGAYVSRTAWTDKVEAEDYDFGGGGVAFVDINTGGAAANYRADETDTQNGPAADDVELNTGSMSNGYSVGWATAGEELSYTIPDIAESNVWLVISTAHPTDANPTVMQVLVNGNDAGTINIASTGGWTTYTESVYNLTIPTDANSDDDVVTLKYVTDPLSGGGCNIDYFKFVAMEIEVYDATTDTKVDDLVDGHWFSINDAGDFNLRCKTYPDPMASGGISFTLNYPDGTTVLSRTENGAPYALFGDASGNYETWSNYGTTNSAYAMQEGTYSLTVTWTSNSTVTQTYGFEVSTPTLVKENLSGLNAYISNNILNVRSNSEISAKIKLYDLSGKIIVNDMFTGKEYVSEKLSQKGVYILKVTTDKSEITQKVILK